MLGNAKELLQRHGAAVLLIGGTLLLIVALRVYSPAQVDAPDPEPDIIYELIDSEYVPELDDRALELIKQSGFAFIRRTQANNCTSYEVYVSEPLTESLQDRTERMCNDMRELWTEYHKGITVRIMVLNYDNMEEVDMAVEDGKVIFRR